jgi:predicted phosphodiesterase
VRYALISDIHANLPAIDAVLNDSSRRGIDEVYHLGDLVGYGAEPNHVVERISRMEILGVSGNYDSTVALGAPHCGCRYEDPRQEAQSHESYAWTRARVTNEARTFLGALPFRIDLRPNGGHAPGPKVVLVHGTPTLNTLYWTEDRDDAFCLKMAAHAGARPGDVICFGHTHKPWTRVVDGIRFVNTGSVGRPKDGDWRAGYVLLDVDAGSSAVEIVRVEYDVEQAMQAIRASTLPADFAEYLRTGGKPNG